MATKVHMEALSPTMEEGQVVKWLKSEGDSVTDGEIIAEIETDKATMELTARGDGVLRTILVPEGGTAPVGAVIALIGTEDEDISEFQATALATSPVNGAGDSEGTVAPADADVAAGDRRRRSLPWARTEASMAVSRLHRSRVAWPRSRASRCRACPDPDPRGAS